MTNLIFSSEYFSPKATLECGQVFRFLPKDGGYFLFCADKACFLKEEGGVTSVLCEDADKEYFENYFDLAQDYAALCEEARAFCVPVLSRAASFGKGLRILRQDKAECLFSFIVSQQNNIPRIKGILSRLCDALGEEKTFCGQTFRTFPSPAVLAQKDENFYRELGLGYRAKYIAETAKKVACEGFASLADKRGEELKKALTAYTGVGNKVADCVCLFAFHECASFPVDTWMEKLYRQDFGGTQTDRNVMNKFFVNKFGKNAGIFQQYLFYYKRETGE